MLGSGLLQYIQQLQPAKYETLNDVATYRVMQGVVPDQKIIMQTFVRDGHFAQIMHILRRKARKIKRNLVKARHFPLGIRLF